MVAIPRNMINDESKVVARVLAAERNLAIAEGYLFAARNQHKAFYKNK